jgi:uncharacterized protein YggT (Ycf19 family)
MLALAADVGAVLARFLLSFYAFWLVWRVLLPLLPGPADPQERIAPFVGYFTDPLVNPVARALRLPTRAVAFALLVLVAALSVGLSRAVD